MFLCDGGTRIDAISYKNFIRGNHERCVAERQVQKDDVIGPSFV